MITEAINTIDTGHRPALTIKQRDAILARAIAYAHSEASYQKALAAGDPAGGQSEMYTAVTTTHGDLLRLLNDATPDTDLSQLQAERHLLGVRCTDLATERDGLQEEAAVLRADKGLLAERNGHLTAENERLNNICDAKSSRLTFAEQKVGKAEQELADFKEQVQEVGYRYADKHDWCEVMDEAMDELGLRRDPIRYGATLTITVEFTATLTSSKRELPDRAWVRSALDTDDLREAIENNLGLGEDHDEHDIDNVRFAVSDITDVS